MLTGATDYIRPGRGAECTLYCEVYLVIVMKWEHRVLLLLTVAMGMWLLCWCRVRYVQRNTLHLLYQRAFPYQLTMAGIDMHLFWNVILCLINKKKRLLMMGCVKPAGQRHTTCQTAETPSLRHCGASEHSTDPLSKQWSAKVDEKSTIILIISPYR